MKSSLKISLAVAACLILAGLAYLGATGIMDSMYAYRSPLRLNPPAPGPAMGQPLTRRVVFVLVDALREDTARDPQVMPFLNELRQSGASATMHSQPPSYSEAGYTVLLTGAWPNLSDGPAMNLDYDEIPAFTQDNLFSAAHRAGLNTAVSGYYWFEKLIPQEAVSAGFYTPGEDSLADREVVDAALPWLDDPSYSLVLIHLDQVDYAGHHEGGPRDPNWAAAAARVDDLLREIAAPLDFTQDTLLVASDHGQLDRGGHGGQDPVTLLEPFVLAGAGVKPGSYGDIQMVDLAPTVAGLLGLNIPASTQGRVRAEMLAISSEQGEAIRQLAADQQAGLLAAYTTAIEREVYVPAGAKDPVGGYQNALQEAHASRLTAERLPRGILALVLVLLPLAALLIAYRGRQFTRQQALWVAAGAGLYLVLFNLRYALLDGRTYSLSSVEGVMQLIVYCAVTAGLAFTISWLVISFALKAFAGSPRQAASLALALGLFTIYLAALPVAWSFAINGLGATWTLPDAASSFMAVLAQVQILFLALFGPLFAGLGALLARFASRRLRLAQGASG